MMILILIGFAVSPQWFSSVTFTPDFSPVVGHFFE